MNAKTVIACAACAAAALPALAADNGDMGEITLNSVLGRFGGGEFAWTGSGGPTHFGTFVSFCIELNEGVAPGSEYKATVNDEAVLGGVGGPSPDPLDSKTAALYQAFVNGSLANYSNTGSISFNSDTYSRQDQAAALQMTIWFIEQEVSSLDAVTAGRTSNQTLADKIEALANFYLGQANALDTGDIGNVRVLNLTRLDGSGNNQDMLYIIPLPQAGVLASLGLAGLAIRRRR